MEAPTNQQSQQIPKQTYQDVYKSAIRASYFHSMNNPDILKKSQHQFQQIHTNIDEKTFRILKNFIRPIQTPSKNYRKRAVIFLDDEYDNMMGFCCFGKKKAYIAELCAERKFAIRGKGMEDGKLVRFVDFDAVCCRVLEKSNKIMIRFEGLSQEQQIKFEFQDPKEHKIWAQLLCQTIHKSLGASKNYIYLALTCPNFYTSQHILLHQFEKKVNTGDILLYRCQHSAARAQRFLTSSQYDHVGVVLRNQRNQILIFESTSEEGVGLTPWREMIQYEWYAECSKIAWRPLSLELTTLQSQKIQQFVTKTLGKEYGISLNKLMVQKSKLIRNTSQQQQKTYFCSELVARLYKELGILDGEKSSASYYPVDFSERGGIRFVGTGVGLGAEKIIAFEKSS